MSNELAMKSENALADIPMNIDDMAADAALGGKVGLADIGIPFLTILQGNSPQVNSDSPKYIDGAKTGMIYVTVLEKILEARANALEVVPCFYERVINEWVPREQGGGLTGSHSVDDLENIMDQAEPNERGQMFLANGHQLIDTAYWYLLLNLSGTWKQCVMPFKSTHMKTSRRWNSQLSTTYIPGTQKVAPRWLYRWKLKTIKEQRDQFVWSSPVVEIGEIVSKNIYDVAKDYAKIAAGGILRRKILAAENKAAQEGIVDGSKLEDEVPF